MEKSSVYFARSLSRARRLARPGENALFASPKSSAALTAALKLGLEVVAESEPGAPFWNHALRRFFLPEAPPLLRAAIGGVSGKPTGSPKAGARPRSEREVVRANWITERLTDRRARELLAEKPVARLWILEDFRTLRVSDRVLSRLAREGIRLAVFRALCWKRARVRS